MNQSNSWYQWFQWNMYIRTTFHLAKIMDILLYKREFIMLEIIVTGYVIWTYKDTSMSQTNMGRILIAILGIQFMI